MFSPQRLLSLAAALLEPGCILPIYSSLLAVETAVRYHKKSISCKTHYGDVSTQSQFPALRNPKQQLYLSKGRLGLIRISVLSEKDAGICKRCLHTHGFDPEWFCSVASFSVE